MAARQSRAYHPRGKQRREDDQGQQRFDERQIGLLRFGEPAEQSVRRRRPVENNTGADQDRPDQRCYAPHPQRSPEQPKP
jgi:hypothetical protein